MMTKCLFLGELWLCLVRKRLYSTETHLVSDSCSYSNRVNWVGGATWGPALLEAPPLTAWLCPVAAASFEASLPCPCFQWSSVCPERTPAWTREHKRVINIEFLENLTSWERISYSFVSQKFICVLAEDICFCELFLCDLTCRTLASQKPHAGLFRDNQWGFGHENILCLVF